MKMKSGPKKMVTGETCYTSHGVREINRRLKSKESVTSDPRPAFLWRVRTTARRFCEYVKHKFGPILTVESAEFIRSSATMWEFDTEKSSQDAKAREASTNIYQFATHATNEELQNSTLLSSALVSEIQDVIELEVTDVKTAEDHVLEEAALNRIASQVLRAALKAAGLPHKGNKTELLTRVKEHDVKVLEDSDSEEEEERLAIRMKSRTAWAKLRKEQLKTRLRMMEADTSGSKIELAKRISRLSSYSIPQDVYQEHRFGHFGHLRDRLSALYDGLDMPVTDFSSALWCCMLMLTRDLGCSVFGGLVRDMVVRGVYHMNADIDTFLPDATSAEDILDDIKSWCTDNDCKFVKATKGHASGSIWKVILRPPGGDDLEVQLIDEQKIIALDPLPDFDCNCMWVKFDQGKGKVDIIPRLAHYVGMPLRDLINKVLQKKVRQLKTIDDIVDENRQMKLVRRVHMMTQLRKYTLI